MARQYIIIVVTVGRMTETSRTRHVLLSLQIVLFGSMKHSDRSKRLTEVMNKRRLQAGGHLVTYGEPVVHSQGNADVGRISTPTANTASTKAGFASRVGI